MSVLIHFMYITAFYSAGRPMKHLQAQSRVNEFVLFCIAKLGCFAATAVDTGGMPGQGIETKVRVCVI